MDAEIRYIKEVPDLPLPNLSPAQKYYRRCRKQAGYQRNYRANLKASKVLERDAIATVTFNMIIDAWARDGGAFPDVAKGILRACSEAGASRNATRQQLCNMVLRRQRQLERNA